MSKTYWHFAKIQNGKPIMLDGTPIEIGKRYTVPEAVMCKSGFHGSSRVIAALNYAPGPWVHQRDIDVTEYGDDKVCGPSCTHVAGFDATEVLRKFARMCALDVIHFWDASEVVVRYLKTGDETIRDAARAEAWSAAWSSAETARNAARNAARVSAGGSARNAARAARDAAETARNAARASAREKQNRRLTRMLTKAMREVDRG